MAQSTPLQQFFRKPRFTIQLPSQGKWYPAGGLTDATGTVGIFSMTAADDLRFRSGDLLGSGAAVYELIKSCVPDIRDPEQIPTVDLDALLLSIRRASYGDEISTAVSVENTSLVRKLTLSIQELVSNMSNAALLWDDTLIITNELDETLTVTLRPISIKSLYNIARQAMKQNQQIRNLDQNNLDLDTANEQIKNMSSLNVQLVCDGIQSLQTNTGYVTSNAGEIRQLISNMDVEYFKAIQDHVEKQKSLLGFQPITLTTTPEEIAAGAPAEWAAEINLEVSEYFK